MTSKKNVDKRTDLLTRKEASSYLGVAVQTLAVWSCTGRYNLPVVKVGRLVRYRRSDLDKFLERGGYSESDERALTDDPRIATEAKMEIVLPTGVIVRLDSDCPPHLLSSIIRAIRTLEEH